MKLDVYKIDGMSSGNKAVIPKDVFEVEPNDSGAIIRQTAMYDPDGLWGLVYWYALYPVHGLIFGGMLRAIAERASRRK